METFSLGKLITDGSLTFQMVFLIRKLIFPYTLNPNLHCFRCPISLTRLYILKGRSTSDHGELHRAAVRMT
jgi:hypothetical protein